MKNFFVILSLFFVSCGAGNKNSSQNLIEKGTDNVSENQIIISEKQKETNACLIGNDLPPLNDSIIRDYGYKSEFEVFDSLIFTHENKTFKIVIENFKEKCPGDFHLIKILVGNELSVFFNPDGWVDGRKYIENVSILSKNNLSSKKYIAINEFSSTDILLFVFGYPYDSNPNLKTIINLTYFSNPQLIFNDEYDLFEITDYNNDKSLDIEISRCFKNMKTDKEGNLLNRDKIMYKYILKNGCFSKW